MIHWVVSLGLRASAWIRYSYNYDAPVRPDRILWIDPTRIQSKPIEKPPTDRIRPTLVASDDWDKKLVPIVNDVVYVSFYQRFIEGKPWDETGYVEFLSTDVSEHGGQSREEALDRCNRLDQLYHYIDEYGYKSQAELEREAALVDGLASSVRPAAYREIAVNITRNGEFVWHAGMHRLVIAQLLEIDRIPVRVHIRHERWQQIRDRVYNGKQFEEYDGHPDLKYLQ